MKQTRHTIVRLLSNIGSRKEVEQYLRRFSSVDSTRFAVVKVGGAILREELDSLASSLSFLYRVGLYPIVVHGGGLQLDEALREADIETERVDGMRVTTPQVLEVARRVFRRENRRLVEKLEELGTRARPIPSGVFTAEPMDRGRYGLVGEVTGIHLDPIRSAIRSGHLPILSSLGETSGGQILNINADVAARSLALDIEPYKIVFLTGTGGLLDEHDRVIPSINLVEDFEHLMSQEWVAGGMQLKLRQIKELLDELSLSSSVSITSPEHLARELFTHRGSGTLVRRGERIERHDDIDEVDRERIAELISSSFGRRLTDDYFETKDFYRVYVSESYRAVAILTLENGMPYLDKIGVTEQARGEGLGGSIWMRIKEEHPRLFWRSRLDNPINGWYFDESDGSFRSGDWIVFWFGLDSFDAIEDCVKRAVAMPETLEPLTAGD
ncbi:MAG: acetylglutamate kinase [Persicimonas sp.]